MSFKISPSASTQSSYSDPNSNQNEVNLAHETFQIVSQFFDVASIRNLASATLHNSEAHVMGYYLGKFESQLSFASAALFAPIHLITNLFLAIVFSPLALIGSEGRNFCTYHLLSTAMDLSAIGIGLIGAFSPDRGQYLFLNVYNLESTKEETQQSSKDIPV